MIPNQTCKHESLFPVPPKAFDAASTNLKHILDCGKEAGEDRKLEDYRDRILQNTYDYLLGSGIVMTLSGMIVDSAIAKHNAENGITVETVEKKKERNCNTCRNGHFNRCEILKADPGFQEVERLNDIKYEFTRDFKFKQNFVCDEHKSRYIEFPLTIHRIETDTSLFSLNEDNIGKFVSIRPCSDEPDKDKTYLGLFLGDLPIGINTTFNEQTGALKESYFPNPAIFVFELNKIVHGCESWWGVIESEEQLRQITDYDINNVWYVKALGSLSGENESSVNSDEAKSEE